MEDLKLGYDLSFDDLYDLESIKKIDKLFIDHLLQNNIEDHNVLVSFRAKDIDDKEYSDLILKLAPQLEEFIAELFDIKDEVDNLFLEHKKYDNLYICKRLFVQRRALKSYKIEDVVDFDIAKVTDELEDLLGEITELNYANQIVKWLEDEDQIKLDIAAKYAAWASLTKDGQHKHKNDVIFSVPKKIDHNNLVAFETEIIDGTTIIKKNSYHARDGFKLTDPGASLAQALDQANYCIYCHHQAKDSCSKGLKDKQGNFRENEQSVTLTGCPLEQKISEMNELKSQGYSIGALATIIIDNPMLAVTGHRICNDCMKSCIYQKQEPVNVPQVETRILKDVLSLPWGFEIYSLLTKWNPLNLKRPIPKEDSNYKILVAGMGPAGFTLAHHLINDGHIVVGIDGLKIEPVEHNISGVNLDGSKTKFHPIRDVNSIYEDLDSRVQAGFGGVAEYGITVRWNKNFLKLVRIILERRVNFSLIGGVRLGSNITIEQAWNLGFDHISLALGAGAPTLLDIPRSMSRGVRTASDFLMSLQLTGAAKSDSIANLQVRLPVIVIGGGLTSIDAATEALAYYPVQVEKFLSRFEFLLEKYGLEKLHENWNAEDLKIAEEFIKHAKELRIEKLKTNPDVISLLKKWGSSTIIYRGKFENSPAYRFNHEEVSIALTESINFIENTIPASIELDEYGHAEGIKDTEGNIYNAKTIIYAIGTSPNNIIADEIPLFSMNGKYFQAIDENEQFISPQKLAKPSKIEILLSKNESNKYISFVGDLHPSYQGSVVKAMASAKAASPIISNILRKTISNSDNDFLSNVNNLLRSKVEQVNKLGENIIELIIKSPFAAKNFKPGQFYRLQNFESLNNTKFTMEGLALTGAIAYKDQDLISLIILTMGGSSDLTAYLQTGEPIILMGPTGTSTEIVSNQTILLAGGGLGNAVLFSIGKAFRDAGSKVIYFAGYKKLSDRFKKEEIEQAADIVIWCCDEGLFEASRICDKSYQGNIVAAIEAYAKNEINGEIKIEEVDRIIAIGSDKMMEAINIARGTKLNKYLKKNHQAIASINSPMQCMMKEICAQCIQKHIDKDTGLVSYIYSCNEQDQNMDEVDFKFLNDRLKQNSLQEKITSFYIKEIMKEKN